MVKLVILLFLLCSCANWAPQEEQDISQYRYDVPSEETEDAN